ncbi:MAG: FtsX-like permease family protein, partial [Acidimicrobiia bacterium]
MLSTLTVAGRAVVKRLAADWLIVGAGFVTILLATVLLASGPVYADAVTISSLQRTLADTPVEDSNIQASVRTYPEFYEQADAAVRATASSALAATGSDIYAHIEAEAFEIEGFSPDARPALASLHYFEGLEDHATLTTGRWPAAGPDVEVVLHSGAARDLSASVGDTVTVVNRRDPSIEVQLEIVGVYEIADPADPYWFNETLSLTGREESTSFLEFGPFATTSASMLDTLTPVRADADWRILPRFENLEVQEVDAYRGQIDGLAAQLTAALFAEVDPEASGSAAGFSINTNLSNLLTDVDRSLTVTRSSVVALLVQLAILAGYALVLTAGLLVDTRRTETNLARSRGASPGQVLGIAVLEGLALTAPAVALGPLLAAYMLRALNRVGPLATVDLVIDPQPTVEAYMLAAIAAGLAIVALAWPAYRSARRFGSSESRHARQSSRGGPQRLGVDLALVALAVIAFWQLQTLGPQISARVRGQFGVDPLLVIAPALALLAGAILALRMIPLLARVAEWWASSRRAAVAALASWQVARRPVRYARSALLLIMAIAIGFFAASYSTTWIASQRDQAAHATGADLDVRPNRATGSSISDLQLSSLHRSIPGVEDSMPVQRLTGQLTGGGALVEVVLLDARRAPDIVNIRSDLSPDFGDLMSDLASARPAFAGIALPGEPTTLRLGIEAVEEIPEGEELEQCGPEPVGPETCFNALARVVLQDGDGMLHRIEVGRPLENEGLHHFEVPLVAPSAGRGATPVFPLRLV